MKVTIEMTEEEAKAFLDWRASCKKACVPAHTAIVSPDMSIIDLFTDVRVSNALLAQDIRTVGQLIGKSAADFLRIRNFGRKSWRILRETLERNGVLLTPTAEHPSGVFSILGQSNEGGEE